MTAPLTSDRVLSRLMQLHPKKIDLTGIYGSCPWLTPLTPEERIMEPRELDWEGKLLKRD